MVIDNKIPWETLHLVSKHNNHFNMLYITLFIYSFTFKPT